VRQHLRGLSLGQSIIHRSTEMIGDLRDLPGGNQRAHGNQASITRRKGGAKPEIPEQKIGRILHEPRRRGAKVGAHLRCPLSFCCFIQWKCLSFAGGNWSIPILRC
jgi:hypothetical protein